jgi:hypothetical protein
VADVCRVRGAVAASDDMGEPVSALLQAAHGWRLGGGGRVPRQPARHRIMYTHYQTMNMSKHGGSYLGIELFVIKEK